MSTYQKDLSREQIESIGRKIAAKNLPNVNRIQKPVVARETFYSKYVKRMLDVAISSVALLVTLPINAVIGVVTCFDVGRPIFFHQDRSGKDGTVFSIVKFRNMKELYSEQGILLPPEDRVTKWGRFVRKTSLDELLNFWSILKGDMSLIGPRPLPPIYLERMSERHKGRLSVRPGLECPPRSLDDSVWTWDDQFENDVWYVENVSFSTDCKMIVNLVKFALNSKNADARVVAGRGAFMGYDESGSAINDAQIPQYLIEEVKAEQ